MIFTNVSNNKLLSLLSLMLVIAGFFLLRFGLEPLEVEKPKLPVDQKVQVTPIIATKSSLLGIDGERVKVFKVVDGDTIQIGNGQTVRFIGIDTPETVDPKRPVGCFGKEASNEVKTLLSGQEIILQKDVSDTDKYNRLLRYIYLPLKSGETLFVNDYLVREGFAIVLTYPPDVKFNKQLLEAQQFAKDNLKGLWKKC